MAIHVGLDPRKDINWVVSPTGNAKELFVERKVDAFIGFPSAPQDLRACNVGRVILSTTTDKPWSEYLCCIVEGNRDWVRVHPIATKRFMPCSGVRTCARRHRKRPHDGSSSAASPTATTTRSRHWPSCPMTGGASSTRRTRCASTRSGFARWA
jgi:hypothetical protein